MAKNFPYDMAWEQALQEACGGNYHEKLYTMDPFDEIRAFHQAFQQYLQVCYCQHLRQELGPALAPQEDDAVLKLKAALIHHWTTDEVESLGRLAVINALAGELSRFKLPEEAYSVVVGLERLTNRPIYNPECKAGTLSDMVKHHRPPLED